MNEETKNPEKTPGRAATVTVLVIMVIYMTVSLATLAFAGIGHRAGRRKPGKPGQHLRRPGRTRSWARSPS